MSNMSTFIENNKLSGKDTPVSKRILLVEDDYALAMGTEYTLKAEGYDVIHAKNVAETRNILYVPSDSDPCDLILLDVMLPDGDGFTLLQEMTEHGIEIPVIFSTAVSDEANIVRGLDLGADDYVTKPYRVKELLSRITAVLRRQERALRKANHQSENTNLSSDEITFGEHTINTKNFRLYKGSTIIECTPAELRLLMELIRNSGVVITRTQLLERLYDSESSFIDDNTLSVYIKRLRDKLEDDAHFIKTVKGIGYRFEE